MKMAVYMKEFLGFQDVTIDEACELFIKEMNRQKMSDPGWQTKIEDLKAVIDDLDAISDLCGRDQTRDVVEQIHDLLWAIQERYLGMPYVRKIDRLMENLFVARRYVKSNPVITAGYVAGAREELIPLWEALQ
jgi:hypothetical protein